MSEFPRAVRKAVEEAIRIVDQGIQYGEMGIDAPPSVGERASVILRDSLAKHDEPNLRYLYAASLFLAGRLDEAREQLGLVIDRVSDHFDALAELDYPTAWRHVFLSPPWSEDAERLPPIAMRWLDEADGCILASLRDGARRVVSVLGRAPAALEARPDSRKLPVAFEFAWRTRTSGPFLALLAGVGSPDSPESIVAADGYVFPWPEGEGHRFEMLIGSFLRQSRTFVVLVDGSGRAVVNREIRFSPADLARALRCLKRLALTRIRSTDKREHIATIARYREEFPADAVRGRLVVRLRGGEMLHDPEVDVDVPDVASSFDVDLDAGLDAIAAPAPAPESAPAPDPNVAPPASTHAIPPVAQPAEVPSPEAAAASAPSPGPPADARAGATIPETAKRRAMRSETRANAEAALRIAALWPFARRERALMPLAPASIGVGAIAGGVAAGAIVATAPVQVLAGAAAGALIALAGLIVLRVRLDGSLAARLDRIPADTADLVTLQVIERVLRSRGAELLPGASGARVRSRLARLLRARIGRDSRLTPGEGQT